MLYPMWVIPFTIMASVIYVNDFLICISSLSFFYELQPCVSGYWMNISTKIIYKDLKFNMSKLISLIAHIAYLNEGTIRLDVPTHHNTHIWSKSPASLNWPFLFVFPTFTLFWTFIILCLNYFKTFLSGLSLQTILHLAFRVKMWQHENLQLMPIAYRIKFSFLSEASKMRGLYFEPHLLICYTSPKLQSYQSTYRIPMCIIILCLYLNLSLCLEGSAFFTPDCLEKTQGQISCLKIR